MIITLDKMIEELKHYTNSDVMEWSTEQVIKTYCNRFGMKEKPEGIYISNDEQITFILGK